MKFRTDFVTNSSSSSFLLTLKVELKNGKTIEFEAASDCEGGTDYDCLSVRKSPKEWAESKDIDELVKIIIDSVKEGLKENDEDDENFGSINVFTEESSFIKQIKEINSMDEIAKITIEGFEDAGYNIEEDDYSGPYANSEIASYDLINKKGSLVRYGYDGYIETGEGTGGELNFSTKGIKRVSKKQPDDWYEEKKERLDNAYSNSFWNQFFEDDDEE